MLAKQYRLSKEKDFEKVFKRGRANYTGQIGVKTIANQFRHNRFGIIVSAKVSKKATERNRIKRRIRQALRQLDKKLIGGYDVVIIALPGLLNLDYQAVKGGLERVFIKLKLFIDR